jgi:hypothetical protein
VFPRLYFLNTDDLLHLFAVCSTKFAFVRTHLPKMTQAISGLDIDFDGGRESYGTIIGVKSQQGEVVGFQHAVDPGVSTIETWLPQLLRRVEASLRVETLESMTNYRPTKRKQWLVFGQPA